MAATVLLGTSLECDSGMAGSVHRSVALNFLNMKETYGWADAQTVPFRFKVVRVHTIEVKIMNFPLKSYKF